jgi:hypothetical protein
MSYELSLWRTDSEEPANYWWQFNAKLNGRTKSRPKGTWNVKPVKLSMYKPQPQHILLTETLSADERTLPLHRSCLHHSQLKNCTRKLIRSIYCYIPAFKWITILHTYYRTVHKKWGSIYDTRKGRPACPGPIDLWNFGRCRTLKLTSAPAKGRPNKAVCKYERTWVCMCLWMFLYPYMHVHVATTGDASTLMALVCRASWGEGPDYNLVPNPKGHYLLK